MSPIAELFDGTELEFPDGTAPEIIQQTAKRITSQKQQQPSGADMNISAAPKKGLMQYIGDEAKAGLKEMSNPSTAQYPGAETIGSYSPTARNVIGSVLGASRAAYSIPTGIAQKYVTEPLKEGAAPYTPERLAQMKQFEPGLYQAISQMSPEEQKAGQERAAETAGTLASIGLTGGGTGLVQKAPNVALRTIGRFLDPMASVGGINRPGALKNALEERTAGIAGATDNLSTAKNDLQQLLDQSATKKTQQENILSNIGQQQQTLKATRPVMPTAPDVSGVNLADTVTAAAPGKVEAGQEFGKVLKGETKRLYGQSSKNYENIAKQFGDEIVPQSALQPIVDEAIGLEGEMRGVAATKRVGMQIPGNQQGQMLEPATRLSKWIDAGDKTLRNLPGESIQQLTEMEKAGTLTTDTYRQVIADAMGSAEKPVDVNKLIRLDQVLSEAGRSYGNSGNIAARSAVRQMQSKVQDALSQTGAASDLQNAKAFHAQISELVGPDSLAQKVFNLKPDQVVANVFLPAESGTRPNISMIRDAKKIYTANNPEAWQELTGSALKQLQTISADINSGTLDAQKFHRNWARYGETFKEALEPDQYAALKGIDSTIARYNIDAKTAMKAMRENRIAATGLKETAQETKAQFGPDLNQLKEQIAGQRGTVRDAQKQLETLNASAKSGMRSGISNPYMWMAVAQVGQALQATFTANWAGAGRQLAQGVVWYTLGNPMYLEKVMSKPGLSKALAVISGASKGTEVAMRDGRYVRMLLDDIQGDMKQKQGQ